MTITADATEKTARATMLGGKPTHHGVRACLRERTERRSFVGRQLSTGGARQFVREVLGSHDCVDDTVTVVNELVTNAVMHTGSGQPGGLVSVEITVCAHLVRIAVIDQGGGPGSLADASLPADDRFGGQGLFAVVSGLTVGWGTYACPGGRVVWAELRDNLDRPEHAE